MPGSLSVPAPNAPSAMREELQELWQHRELLLLFVQRDLKVRYKNSILGFGWSLLNPLVQVLTIAIMLQFLLRNRVPSYHAYLFCATLPWLFFSTSIMDSTNSLLAYYNILRKTYFPREILPLATVIANFIHFLLATVVLIAYLLLNSLFWAVIYHKFECPILPTVLLLPIPMLGLAMLVTGIAMVISVWTLYYEDIRFLADSGLKILYWLVPVLWYPDLIRVAIHPVWKGHALFAFCMANPLAAFITAFKKLTLVPAKMPEMSTATAPMGAPEWLFLGLALLTSFGVLIVGHRYFSRRKWALAERG